MLFGWFAIQFVFLPSSSYFFLKKKNLLPLFPPPHAISIMKICSLAVIMIQGIRIYLQDALAWKKVPLSTPLCMCVLLVG